MISFLDAIKMIGDLIFFFTTLKKSSKKMLFGSPATIIIGLKFTNFQIFFYSIEINFRILI